MLLKIWTKHGTTIIGRVWNTRANASMHNEQQLFKPLSLTQHSDSVKSPRKTNTSPPQNP
jgi:hypothetical protein